MHLKRICFFLEGIEAHPGGFWNIDLPNDVPQGVAIPAVITITTISNEDGYVHYATILGHADDVR